MITLKSMTAVFKPHRLVFAALPLLVAAGCSKKAEEAAARDAAGSQAAATAPAHSAEQAADGARLADKGARGTDMFGAAEMHELVVVHFPFDSAELTVEMQEQLRNNAEFLRANPEARIVVEGHTDERGPSEYNLALGERRAKAVRDYLTRLGIDSSRLETVSYGAEMPVDSASNENAWARNRRAQFRELQ